MRCYRHPFLRLLNVIVLVQSRQKRNERFTRTQLASELECSVKTVQRDIVFLRDQMRVPIEYNYAREQYEIKGPLNLPFKI